MPSERTMPGLLGLTTIINSVAPIISSLIGNHQYWRLGMLVADYLLIKFLIICWWLRSHTKTEVNTVDFSDKSQPTFIEVLICTYNQLHDVCFNLWDTSKFCS